MLCKISNGDIELCSLWLSSTERTANEHCNYTLLYSATLLTCQSLWSHQSLSKFHVVSSSSFIRVQCLQVTQNIHFGCINSELPNTNPVSSVQSPDTLEWFSPLFSLQLENEVSSVHEAYLWKRADGESAACRRFLRKELQVASFIWSLKGEKNKSNESSYLSLIVTFTCYPYVTTLETRQHVVFYCRPSICAQVWAYLITLWKRQDRFPLSGSLSGLSTSLWKCQRIVKPVTRLLKGGEAWKAVIDDSPEHTRRHFSKLISKQEAPLTRLSTFLPVRSCFGPQPRILFNKINPSSQWLATAFSQKLMKSASTQRTVYAISHLHFPGCKQIKKVLFFNLALFLILPSFPQSSFPVTRFVALAAAMDLFNFITHGGGFSFSGLHRSGL